MDKSPIQGTSTAASRGVRLRGGDHDESSSIEAVCQVPPVGARRCGPECRGRDRNGCHVRGVPGVTVEASSPAPVHAGTQLPRGEGAAQLEQRGPAVGRVVIVGHVHGRVAGRPVCLEAIIWRRS